MTLSADVLFCDDIRQEASGKFIMIGVYASDLVAGAIPNSFPFALLIRVYGLSSGQHPFKIAVESPGAGSVFQQQAMCQVVDEKTPCALVFSGFPITITQPGEIRVRLEISGQTIDVGSLLVKTPSLFPSNAN